MMSLFRATLSVSIFVLACASAFAGAHGGAPGSTDVPLFDGLSTIEHKITTSSPKAQAYFNQGLRLIYAFNHDEAILAFREALKYDPNCAMAYWGIAAAKGPNYNAGMDEEQKKASLEAIAKAQELVSNVTQAERDYIAAMTVRYSADPNAARADLDKAYSEKMRDLANKYPDDDNAHTLFAESMMNLRPWQLWSKTGEPAPGTLEIMEHLETVLKRNKKHPGAIHYYIHTTEASLNPGKAEPYADLLADLTPNAGHLVHMPAHTYIRTGRYNDAVKLNVRAADVDRAFIAFRKPQGAYPMMYYPHNIHFIWSCAAIEGRSKLAVSAARDLMKATPVDAIVAMPMAEFAAPVPYFAHVRFGLWDEMLKEARPPLELQYTTGMWNYSRAMAFAGLNQLDLAKAEAAQLAQIRDSISPDLGIGLNNAKALLTLAHTVITAELARKEGKQDDAIKGFTDAVALEDAMTYEEPPAWYQPVRLLLGAALLDAKRPAEAETAYREDLKHYPKNGWALFGLEKSLRDQGKKSEARKVRKQFKTAWKRADVKLATSRF